MKRSEATDFVQEEPELKVDGYGWGGSPQKPDHHKCLAKSVFDTSTNKTSYYAKVVTDGNESGNLYNPISLFSTEGDLKAINPYKGIPLCEFRKVSSIVFEYYLKFLKTCQYTYYAEAQRRFLNGG